MKTELLMKKVDYDLVAAKSKRNTIHFKDNESGNIYAMDITFKFK